ncbi:hypothetical protein [Aquipuribacter hungaricus]|uniref:Uncharacterized protein n=1 Tax=Aquipuribacter hungaricus TaxID=545624 RepID=A0ABV7WEX4_9MICO
MTVEPAGAAAELAGPGAKTGAPVPPAPERSRRVLRLRLVLGVFWAAATLVLVVGRWVPDEVARAVVDRPLALALVLLVAWLATLWLVVAGPEPYRATRWAWAWLLAPGLGPLGPLACVVLSGPTPGLGVVRPAGRRLRGGWALLVSLALSAALARLLSW